jgi:fatty acid desaturase
MQSTIEAIVTETAELRQAVKRLSRVHPSIFIYHIVEVWLVIAAAVYVSAVLIPISSGVLGIVVYLTVVAVIASRQHALMVLTHDGIHKRLSRSLWMNDWGTRLFAAFPVFISLSKWRFIHLCHHQCTHSPDDPDRAIYARYPLGGEKFWRLLLRDVFGLNVISTLKYFIDIPFLTATFNRSFLGKTRAMPYSQSVDMRGFAIFWSMIVLGGICFGGSRAAVLFVLYWLVPYCTFTQVFFRIRGAIEHGNVPNPYNLYHQTRTYFIHPMLGFFFSPKQVNYHLEHHLYPSVPFYYLPQLHTVLQRLVYPHERGYCEGFAESLRKLVKG